MAVFKIAYLTYQTFYLGLLRPVAVGFCPLRQRQYTPETLLPNVLLWVLQFFSILFNFIKFYFTKSKLIFYSYIIWNLIYILFWKFAACSFQISDWLKTAALLYFEKKSYMINQKSRALCDFLKIVYDQSKYSKIVWFLEMHCMICHI